jgi:hypothetical protein
MLDIKTYPINPTYDSDSLPSNEIYYLTSNYRQNSKWFRLYYIGITLTGFSDPSSKLMTLYLRLTATDVYNFRFKRFLIYLRVWAAVPDLESKIKLFDWLILITILRTKVELILQERIRQYLKQQSFNIEMAGGVL